MPTESSLLGTASNSLCRTYGIHNGVLFPCSARGLNWELHSRSRGFGALTPGACQTPNAEKSWTYMGGSFDHLAARIQKGTGTKFSGWYGVLALDLLIHIYWISANKVSCVEKYEYNSLSNIGERTLLSHLEDVFHASKMLPYCSLSSWCCFLCNVPWFVARAPCTRTWNQFFKRMTSQPGCPCPISCRHTPGCGDLLRERVRAPLDITLAVTYRTASSPGSNSLTVQVKWENLPPSGFVSLTVGPSILSVHSSHATDPYLVVLYWKWSTGEACVRNLAQVS